MYIYIYQDHSRSKHKKIKKVVINFLNPGGTEKLGFPVRDDLRRSHLTVRCWIHLSPLGGSLITQGIVSTRGGSVDGTMMGLT